MSRAFTGDFSTGDLTQWNNLISSGPVGRTDADYFRPAADNPHGSGDHTIQLVRPDNDAAWACRFELRDDDSFGSGGDSAGMTGAQKAELTEWQLLLRPGETWWHAWSIKFEAFSLPEGRGDNHFLVLDEWHSHNTPPMPVGGVTVFWGAPPWSGLEGQYPGTPDGHFSLCVDKYSQGGPIDPEAPFDWDYLIGREILLNVPVSLGNWIDIKMQVRYSHSDEVGFVRCWINNVAQNLAGGGTTWYGRTTLGTPLTPPADEHYYAQPGIYRCGSNVSPMLWDDMIIYHTGYRIASTEAGL